MTSSSLLPVFAIGLSSMRASVGRGASEAGHVAHARDLGGDQCCAVRDERGTRGEKKAHARSLAERGPGNRKRACRKR